MNAEEDDKRITRIPKTGIYLNSYCLKRQVYGAKNINNLKTSNQSSNINGIYSMINLLGTEVGNNYRRDIVSLISVSTLGSNVNCTAV